MNSTASPALNRRSSARSSRQAARRPPSTSRMAPWTKLASCGYVDLLWVREDERGSGLGARLLATAEAEIRRRGCDRVALSTHTFQAPGFYARLGYAECGRTPGYPHGHDDIHLVKQLT
jgi:GNAT superfamily N-acetyltransferase